MPVNGSYGSNLRSTPKKQEALNSVAGHLIGSSCGVGRKWGWPVFVLDMTCGPGCDPATGADGSPMILARHCIRTSLRLDYPIRFLYVDRDRSSLNQATKNLRSRYEGYGSKVTAESFASQRDAIDILPHNTVGLAYWDPTKYNDLDIDAVTRLARRCSRIDVLVTRQCLAGKRMGAAGLDVMTLGEFLVATGKKRRYAMKYANHGWWTLGFASNWAARDEGGWEFIDIDTAEGQELLQKLEALPANPFWR
jgi:hypothetical protein